MMTLLLPIHKRDLGTQIFIRKFLRLHFQYVLVFLQPKTAFSLLDTNFMGYKLSGPSTLLKNEGSKSDLHKSKSMVSNIRSFAVASEYSVRA